MRSERPRKLFEAIIAVLTEAIAAGGSSISDYVDAEGRKGFFQFSHRVYQRTGEPCVTCERRFAVCWCRKDPRIFARNARNVSGRTYETCLVRVTSYLLKRNGMFACRRFS